jgi:tetratricopeptide (TPR) repeat protein
LETVLIILLWGLLHPQQPADALESVRALAERAAAEQKSQDFAGAERDYKAALALEPRFAELHMNLGLVYQLQNRIAEAIPEFRAALEIKPGLTGANFFLGVDYCKRGEAAKAIPYLKAAAREEPESKDISFWLGRALEEEGDTQGEVKVIEKALVAHPTDADLLYELGWAHELLAKKEVAALEKGAPGSYRVEQLLGESYAASSEWPMAVLHFQNAMQSAPAAPGLHAEAGDVYLRTGNLAGAISEFDAELQRDPHSLRAIARRGEAELLSGETDAALRDLSQAADADEAQAERILGTGANDRGEPAQDAFSEETRAKAQEIVPAISSRSESGARLALKFIAAVQGEGEGAPAGSETEAPPAAHAEAKACTGGELEKALAEERYSTASQCLSKMGSAEVRAELRMKAAEALVVMGNDEAALSMLNAFPASAAHSPDARYWKARCEEKLGAASFLKLVQSNPDSYRFHEVMADLAEAKGDDNGAIKEYRAALAEKPNLPGLHYSLGHLLWKNLSVAEARKEFEAELAIDPNHNGALLELGDTFLLEHRPDKALPYLKNALANEPQNLDVHRDLGTAYYGLGEAQQAEQELKIALPEDHDGSIHYKLARVYVSLGEKEKAAQEFAASSAINRESHEKLERQTERLAEIEKSAQRR